MLFTTNIQLYCYKTHLGVILLGVYSSNYSVITHQHDNERINELIKQCLNEHLTNSVIKENMTDEIRLYFKNANLHIVGSSV